MAYTFDPLLAVDPSNPSTVAANSQVVLFEPGDASQTPVALTTPDGAPFANPVTTTAEGFTGAFQHATLGRLAWAGGGFSNFITAHDSIKQEAVAARDAAQLAAENAAAELSARIAAGEFQGEPGRDGSNVVPTAQAIADELSTEGTPARTALNATTAENISTPGNPVRDAVTETFATELSASGAWTDASNVVPSALPFGRKTLFLGDSHTDGAGATNVTFAFASVSGRIAGTELVSVIRAGFPGERTDQLLGRVDGLLTTHDPDMVFLMCGTNDAGQAVASATFIANVQAIKAKLDVQAIPLVIGYVPPRAASAAADVKARITAYNQRLYRWATDKGVPVADTHGALVYPLTGSLLAAYDSGDSTHFNNAGHLALAKTISPVLVAGAKKAPWPVRSYGLGLLLNPLNDTTLAGWAAVSGSPSASYTDPVAGDGLTAGKWYTMAFDNTAGGSQANMIRAQDVNQAGINVGDQLVAFFKLKSSGGASVAARWISGSTTVSIPVDGIFVDVPYSGFITSVYTVTEADKTRFRLGFSVGVPAGLNGSGSMGQMEVYNLTTGGLVGLY